MLVCKFLATDLKNVLIPLQTASAVLECSKMTKCMYIETEFLLKEAFATLNLLSLLTFDLAF